MHIPDSVAAVIRQTIAGTGDWTKARAHRKIASPPNPKDVFNEPIRG